MIKTNARTRAATRAAGVIGGAMAMGLLIAATVPTSMRQPEGGMQTSRGNPAYQADYTFDYALVDTGPEDLTPAFAPDFAPGFSPAAWYPNEASTAAAAYDPAPQGLYDDAGADDLLRASDPQPAYEPLPIAVMVTRGSDREQGASDAAGRSADAARAAAADVRAVENAIVQGPGEPRAAPEAPPEAEQSAPAVTGA